MLPRLAKQARQISAKRPWGRLVSSLLLAVAVGWLAHTGLSNPWLVGVAIAVVAVVELLPRRQALRQRWLEAVPLVLTGAAVAVLVALSSRRLSQIVIVVLYAWWRARRVRRGAEVPRLGESLIVMAVVFEAIFLGAAIWQHVPVWVWLGLTWASAYALVYQDLTARGERLARIMAATWSLIVVEVSWVLLSWAVTYVLVGSYILIPQATLILTGLAYCFGGIYVSQRQQALTRARLTEYLLIALLLVVIVVSSTPWRGTL